MEKVITGFSKFSDALLLVLAQAVLAALTGNLYFPNPIPSIATLTTAINSYMAALSAAHEGGKAAVISKNARKQELVNMLAQLSNYINLTADGNLEMLGTCGIPIQKGKDPLPPLEKPEIIKIVNGANSGDVKVFIKSVRGARNFAFQCTLDPLTDDAEWTSIYTTQIKCSFSGLEAGKKYWFRVIAYGTDEQVVYGDPVLSRIIQ